MEGVGGERYRERPFANRGRAVGEVVGPGEAHIHREWEEGLVGVRSRHLR